MAHCAPLAVIHAGPLNGIVQLGARNQRHLHVPTCRVLKTARGLPQTRPRHAHTNTKRPHEEIVNGRCATRRMSCLQSLRPARRWLPVPPVTRPAPVTALGAGWCWDWSCTATRRMQCAGPRPCTAGSSMDLRGIGAPARAQPAHWTKRNKTKHPTRRSLCRLSDPGSTRTRRPLGP